MHLPSSKQESENIARDFQETLNFSYAVGAIDAKHTRIQYPQQSGTLFHNYKGFFSFELLTICDACFYFSLVDIGQYGSNNDAGVLANSSIGQKVEAGKMNISPPRHLDGCSFDPLPDYIGEMKYFPSKPVL